MTTKLTVLSVSVALVTAVVVAMLYWRWSEVSTLATKLEMQRLQAMTERADADRLRAELAAAEKRLQDLARELSAARARELEARRIEEEQADPTEGNPEAKIGTRQSRSGPYVLDDIEDAQALASVFLEKLDLESLWMLAADLLALGEPGYERLVELWGRIGVEEQLQRMFKELWDDDLIVGPFLGVVAEHRDDVLRFALWLQETDDGSLPKSFASLRDEMSGEMGAVLLGAYDGSDPELMAGWLEVYRARLQGDPARIPRFKGIVQGLSQLRTPEAGALLQDVARRVPDTQLVRVIQALAWHGSPEALPFLRQLSQEVTGTEITKAIEAAIRHLEWRSR